MSLFAFFFSLQLIFTSVAASSSHLLTTATKSFMFFFQRNSPPFYLSPPLALSLLSIHVSVDIKM